MFRDLEGPSQILTGIERIGKRTSLHSPARADRGIPTSLRRFDGVDNVPVAEIAEI
jgi:hypothetical protein